jgi:hypothetical protein
MFKPTCYSLQNRYILIYSFVETSHLKALPKHVFEFLSVKSRRKDFPKARYFNVRVIMTSWSQWTITIVGLPPLGISGVVAIVIFVILLIRIVAIGEVVQAESILLSFDHAYDSRRQEGMV